MTLAEQIFMKLTLIDNFHKTYAKSRENPTNVNIIDNKRRERDRKTNWQKDIFFTKRGKFT